MSLDRSGFTERDETAEQRQGVRAVVGRDVELRDDVLRVAANSPHEAVADDSPVDPEQVRVGPPARVPGVEYDLAVHLVAMELAEVADFLGADERPVAWGFRVTVGVHLTETKTLGA